MDLSNGDVMLREAIGVYGLFTPLELAYKPNRAQSDTGVGNRLYMRFETFRTYTCFGYGLS